MAADVRWPQVRSLIGEGSYAGAPIRVKGRVIGFLQIITTTPRSFTPQQGEQLQAFADQAAGAIENARLYDQVQHYADELEQRVAERTHELSSAYERLKALDHVKDQFVSRVSHELRTPIANVKLYISLLTRGKPDKYDEYLQTLRREAARLEKLIEDLLDLSRLDLGRQPIALAPTDVNQLTAQLITDRTALAAARQLLIDYRADLPLALAQADPAMLNQVISNLLTNAINYTPAGGVITVSTSGRERDEQNWITITIHDTGPGISVSDRARLFERFFRGEAGRKSGAPGTGLGLAISAQIMNKLNGLITLDSPPGEGAVFTVWLKPAA
jgi:signal transduction histidine kinase